MANQKLKVLIIGGGFGGVKSALELADSDHFAVTLLSHQANFRYYPMLYESTTGGSAVASSIPLAEIFTGQNIKLVKDSAKKLDRQAKKIITSNGQSYKFDILIIALGVVTNYFGIKGLKRYSYGIKTLEGAHELRDHLHQQLSDQHKPDLNYIVIG